jgi:hypothetical protein
MVLAPGLSPFSSLTKDGSRASPFLPLLGEVLSSAAGRGNSSSNPGRFSVSAFFGLRPLFTSAIDQLQFPSLVYKMWIISFILNVLKSCMMNRFQNQPTSKNNSDFILKLEGS